MLVYLYSHYWIFLNFLQFLHQIFFFHFWESGGGELTVVLPLKLSAEVDVCLFLCTSSHFWQSLSDVQPEQLSPRHWGCAAVALRASGRAVLFIYFSSSGLQSTVRRLAHLWLRDTVAAVPPVCRQSQTNRGEAGMKNVMPGKVLIPVTGPACAQTHQGSSVLIPAFEDQGNCGSDNLQQFRKPFPFA